jgi:hypothetical protein
MTLIEIRPHRWGWKVFEAPGVEPVFPAIRVYDEAGNVIETHRHAGQFKEW